MASGSRSGAYWDLFCGEGLPPMVMGGRYKARLPQSTVKVLLNQS